MDKSFSALLADTSSQAQSLRGSLLSARTWQQAIQQQLIDSTEPVADNTQARPAPLSLPKPVSVPIVVGEVYASGERSASPRAPDEGWTAPHAEQFAAQLADIKANLRRTGSSPTKHVPTTGLYQHADNTSAAQALHVSSSGRRTRTTEEAVFDALSDPLEEGSFSVFMAVPPTEMGTGIDAAAGYSHHSCESYVSLLLSPRTTKERLEEEGLIKLGGHRVSEHSDRHLTATEQGVRPNVRASAVSHMRHTDAPSDSGVLFGSPLNDTQEDTATSQAVGPQASAPASPGSQQQAAYPHLPDTLPAPLPTVSPSKPALSAFNLKLITKPRSRLARDTSPSPRSSLPSPRVPLGMAPSPCSRQVAPSHTQPKQQANKAKKPKPAAKPAPLDAAAAAAAAEAAAEAAAAVTKMDVLARLRRANEAFNKVHPPGGGQGKAAVQAAVASKAPALAGVRREQHAAARPVRADKAVQAPATESVAGAAKAAGEHGSARRDLYMQLLQQRRRTGAHTGAAAPGVNNRATEEAHRQTRLTDQEQGARPGSCADDTAAAGEGEPAANGFVIVSRRATADTMDPPPSVCTTVSLEHLMPGAAPARGSAAAPHAKGPVPGLRAGRVPVDTVRPISCESVQSMAAKTSPIKPRYERELDRAAADAGKRGAAVPGGFRRLTTGSEQPQVGVIHTARDPRLQRKPPVPARRAVSAGRRDVPAGATDTRQPVRGAGRPPARGAAGPGAGKEDNQVILKVPHRVPGAAPAAQGRGPAASPGPKPTWQVKEVQGVPPTTAVIETPGFKNSPWLSHELVHTWRAAAAAAADSSTPVGYTTQHLSQRAAMGEHSDNGVAEASDPGAHKQGVVAGMVAALNKSAEEAATAVHLHGEPEPVTPLPPLTCMAGVGNGVVADIWQPASLLEVQGSPSPGTKMRTFAHTAAALIAGHAVNAASAADASIPVHTTHTVRSPSPGHSGAQAAEQPSPAVTGQSWLTPVRIPSSPTPVPHAVPGITSPRASSRLHRGSSSHGIPSPKGPALGASISKPFTQLTSQLGSPRSHAAGSGSVSRLPSQRPTHEDLALSEMSVILVRKTTPDLPSQGELVGIGPEEVLKRTLRRTGPAPRASPVKPHSATIGLPPHLAGFKGPGAQTTYAAAGHTQPPHRTPSPAAKHTATALPRRAVLPPPAAWSPVEAPAATAAVAATAAPADTECPAVSPAGSPLIPRYAAATAASAARLSPHSVSPLSRILAAPQQHASPSPAHGHSPAGAAAAPRQSPNSAVKQLLSLMSSTDAKIAKLEAELALDGALDDDFTVGDATGSGQLASAAAVEPLLSRGAAAPAGTPAAAVGAPGTAGSPRGAGVPDKRVRGEMARSLRSMASMPSLQEERDTECLVTGAGVNSHPKPNDTTPSAPQSQGPMPGGGSPDSGTVLLGLSDSSGASEPSHVQETSSLTLRVSQVLQQPAGAVSSPYSGTPNKAAAAALYSGGSPATASSQAPAAGSPAPGAGLLGASVASTLALPPSPAALSAAPVQDAVLSALSYIGGGSTQPAGATGAGRPVGDVERLVRELTGGGSGSQMVGATVQGEQLLGQLPAGVVVQELLDQLHVGVPVTIPGGAASGSVEVVPTGGSGCWSSCLAPLTAALGRPRSSGSTSSTAACGVAEPALVKMGASQQLARVSVTGRYTVLSLWDRQQGRETATSARRVVVQSFAMKGLGGSGWQPGAVVTVRGQPAAGSGNEGESVVLCPGSLSAWAKLVLGLNSALQLADGRVAATTPLSVLEWVACSGAC